VAKPIEKTSSALVDIRKAPKFIAFAATAALIGLVVSSMTALVIQAPGNFFGYVIVWGTVLFAFAGVIVALIFEAILRSRSKRIEATKIEG
jgi:asparagine N-glycosylation enzyme membrane subunit Stt3